MIEEQILDLCTRATKLFVPDDLPDAVVSVAMQALKDHPKFWQVWFVMYDAGGPIPNKTLDNKSLVEGADLIHALNNLDDWLCWEESQSLFYRTQGSEIAELIGYGD